MALQLRMEKQQLSQEQPSDHWNRFQSQMEQLVDAAKGVTSIFEQLDLKEFKQQGGMHYLTQLIEIINKMDVDSVC